MDGLGATVGSAPPGRYPATLERPQLSPRRSWACQAPGLPWGGGSEVAGSAAAGARAGRVTLSAARQRGFSLRERPGRLRIAGGGPRGPDLRTALEEAEEGPLLTRLRHSAQRLRPRSASCPARPLWIPAGAASSRRWWWPATR